MSVSELVKRARRRLLWNEILTQAVHAVSVAFGGLILLLLLGTQILDWRWLLLVSFSSLGLGVYRTIRRLPSSYRVAQLVDRRMSLADALSTALFFDEPKRALKVSETVRKAQLAAAGRIAEQVSLKRALPFTLPKAIYITGVLGLIASSLFGLRYGLDRRLDLRPPLARVLQDSFGTGPIQEALQHRKRQPLKPQEGVENAGLPVQDRDRNNPGELDAAPDSVLDTVGVPDVDNDKAGSADPGGKSKARSGADRTEGEQPEGESTENANASTGGENGPEGQQGEGEGSQKGQSSAAKETPGSSGENSSLLSKLRDAMSGLMSRMKPQPNGGGSQQPSTAGENAQQGRNQQAKGDQKGMAGQGQQQGASESDSRAGQEGEDSQNSQSAQGKGSGKSSEQQASNQPGSGMGKQDGSKDVKLAEHMAAMGKISEIIGKRSANITGEVTVEVQSGNQQLRTQYSQRAAKHTEAGGEISRDEVPVMYQQYVQQYFEQVRKSDAETRRKSSP